MAKRLIKKDPQYADQAQRLNIVYRELVNSKNPLGIKKKKEFAQACGVADTTMSRTMNGRVALSKRITNFVVLKLGYNADWLMRGIGDKRDTGKKESTLTEVQALRAEITILRNEIQRNAARTIGTEHELENLKNELKAIRDELKKVHY